MTTLLILGPLLLIALVGLPLVWLDDHLSKREDNL